MFIRQKIFVEYKSCYSLLLSALFGIHCCSRALLGLSVLISLCVEYSIAQNKRSVVGINSVAFVSQTCCIDLFLTQMSDAGLFVWRFRSLLLLSADNASAALTPGQTARQRALRARPAEADQDPEAVDGCLVCSCCSSDYA